MNCKQIIISWLEDHGFDGLYNHSECGCTLDDFMPCGGENIDQCEPGYEVSAPEGSSYDSLISPTKEEVK